MAGGRPGGCVKDRSERTVDLEIEGVEQKIERAHLVEPAGIHPVSEGRRRR